MKAIFVNRQEVTMGYSLSVGSKLGKYEITGRLGSGGAANVFKARNVETGKMFALKTLTPETTTNEEIHKRFVREIAVAQKLSHDNIVKYYDCEVHDEILFYTMEIVPWGNLGDVMRGGRIIPWQDVAECGIDICKGLRHFHDAGIVHRDLKPHNIFLSDDGKLKIGDFGLAMDPTLARLTIDGQTVGTAKYLAPEQARAGELDGRTDIYALGCILFEMLAGRPPFLSNGDTYVYHLMKQHVETAPPKVSDFNSSCPTALVALVDSMLAKSPQNRPVSAEQTMSRLAEILADPDTQPKWVKNPATDEVEPKSLTARLYQDSSVERKVNPKALVAIALVSVLIIAAVFVARALQ